MPRSNNRSPIQSPTTPTSGRQTRSAMSHNGDATTLVAGLDSASPTSYKSPRNAKRSTLAHTSTGKKRKVTASSEEGASTDDSEGDSDDEPPEAEEEDDEDGQPAVNAPSYGNGRKKGGHKTGLIKEKKNLKLVSSKKKAKLNNENLDTQSPNGSQHPALQGTTSSVIKLEGNAQQQRDDHVLQSLEETGNIDEAYDASESSDEDDYAGVDDISDANEEELDVERLEEQMIVDSEDENVDAPAAPGMLLGWSGEWEGFGLDEQLLFANVPFIEDNILNASFERDGSSSSDLADEVIETAVQRRVHFEDDDDTSDDIGVPTLLAANHFSTDFLQQDSLDPNLRRMIDDDEDEDVGQYTAHGQGYGTTTGIYSADGYGTDDDERTDEDLPPPATVTHPRSTLLLDTATPVPLDLTGSLSSRRARSQPLPRRRGPIRGTFIADRNKPMAIIDCTGKRMVILPPTSTNRHDWLFQATESLSSSANNSPRTSLVNLADDSENDISVPNSQEILSPGLDSMLSSSANFMMTGLFHGAPGSQSYRGGQVMGPPEAFYESNSFVMDGTFDDDDDDDGEDLLNVDDFIDFGDGSSDEDMDKDGMDTDELTSPVFGAATSGTTTPTGHGNNDSENGVSAEKLLSHFDKSIVTAFRRNHHRYQTMLKVPSNSPAASSAFRHGKLPSLGNAFSPSRNRKASRPLHRPSKYAGAPVVKRKLMSSPTRGKL